VHIEAVLYAAVMARQSKWSLTQIAELLD